ncbi:hypothetical protein LX36DRAFT_752772 [Colletotrichum falcatum]|nr:hypothetical protein LX36DRAFT_752772 [Colletotrichum falcatum]
MNETRGPAGGNSRPPALVDEQPALSHDLRIAISEMRRTREEADRNRAAFDACGRDAERLCETLAREEEYIGNLRAEIGRAHDRCLAAQREYAARWGDPEDDRVRAALGYASSAEALTDARLRLQKAHYSWAGGYYERALGIPKGLAGRRPPAAEELRGRGGDGPGDESGEDGTEQSEDKENKLPGRGHPALVPAHARLGMRAGGDRAAAAGEKVQDWLSSSTAVTNSADDDDGDYDGSPVSAPAAGGTSVTDGSQGSRSPSRGGRRPGERRSADRDRRRSPIAAGDVPDKYETPTRRQQTPRRRGSRHQPYRR